MANLSQCKTEDSRKHLEIESSLPRVAMDRGFFACGTDADLVTNAMLIQNLTARWKAVRCPAKLQSLMRSVVCWNLDTNGLGKVLFEGVLGSATQTFVDPVWVGRGEG